MRAVIFDVDGTLWDSTEKVAVSWREAAEEFGVSADHITGERLKSEFGKTLEDIGVSLFPDLPVETALAITRRACETENESLLVDPPTVYSGVPELFRRLKETGANVYIVSNSQKGYVEVLLAVSELGSYVDGHLCAGDTGLEKAGTMRELIRRTGAENPIYVGDTFGDYTATKEVGLPFVFAAYGFGDVPNPDAVIHQPLELLDVIKRL